MIRLTPRNESILGDALRVELVAPGGTYLRDHKDTLVIEDRDHTQEVHLHWSDDPEGLEAARELRDAAADLVRRIEGRLCARCQEVEPVGLPPRPALCRLCLADAEAAEAGVAS